MTSRSDPCPRRAVTAAPCRREEKSAGGLRHAMGRGAESFADWALVRRALSWDAAGRRADDAPPTGLEPVTLRFAGRYSPMATEAHRSRPLSWTFTTYPPLMTAVHNYC